jgi:stage III sporulation protein AG
MRLFSIHPTDESAPRDNRERRRSLWILGGAFLGILLLLLGGGALFSEKKEETEVAPYRPEEDEVVLYQTYLEERVRALCRSVRGTGNVTAVVSLSGSFSSVYATEWKDGNEEYVILGSGSSAAPIYLTRATPEIVGIGIVCDGGADAAVRRELTELLSATFHLSSNRIYVTAAK